MPTNFLYTFFSTSFVFHYEQENMRIIEEVEH